MYAGMWRAEAAWCLGGAGMELECPCLTQSTAFLPLPTPGPYCLALPHSFLLPSHSNIAQVWRLLVRQGVVRGVAGPT